MENVENICVKAEDVKKVLEQEGVNTESLKALSGEKLSEKDLEEIVGGFNPQKMKEFAVKGLKLGVCALAVAGTAYAATDIAVNGMNSLAGQGVDLAGKGVGAVKDFFSGTGKPAG